MVGILSTGVAKPDNKTNGINKINKYRKEEKLVSFTFQDMNVDSMVCNDETAKRLNLEDENGN